MRNARTGDNGRARLAPRRAAQEEGQADLSFASLLPGSLPDWQAGPLTLRQVWAFYPYENSLVTVRATGRQVREALEAPAGACRGSRFRTESPVWKRNAAVWGYNCDTLDGADYALDPTRPKGKRLLFLRRNGRDVRDDETFTVAINSYRASGGGGYGVWRNCPAGRRLRSALRELLLEDARRRKTIELHANENWFLSPALPEGRFFGFLKI